MQNAKVFTRNQPPQSGDLSSFGRRFLAVGDSWFTLGTLNLGQATNVLLELRFKNYNGVMSWALSGDTLQRMVDSVNDKDFDRALWNRTGNNFASFWEAILISAGGNDLIEAAGVPSSLDGKPVPPEKRLFLTAEEASTLPSASHPLSRISDAGWVTLTDHLLSNFQILAERKSKGPSKDSPLIVHTYSMPAPRPSGAGYWSRGWLYPAMESYGIRLADMADICDELFERLRLFLTSIDQASGHANALPHLHVFDSARAVNIASASPGASGVSGDWVNEIHLTAAGYRKMSQKFGHFIDRVVDSTYGPI